MPTSQNAWPCVGIVVASGEYEVQPACAAPPGMKKLTSMVQLEFVRFKELERLTRIKAGVSKDVEARLKHGRVLEEVLKQDANMPVSMDDQVMTLYAFQNGLFMDVDPVDVRPLVDRFLKEVHAGRPDLVAELVRDMRLTDRVKEGLNEQIAKISDSAPKDKG